MKIRKLSLKMEQGIYESMNLGIQEASGDIISILNSDDIYQNEKTISDVINIISKNPDCPIFLGDVVYFKTQVFLIFIDTINLKILKDGK